MLQRKYQQINIDIYQCEIIWVFFNNGKCSKISSTFLLLFSNKIMIFRAGIHKMDVRIANSEDPDQTASSEAVRSGSALFV